MTKEQIAALGAALATGTINREEGAKAIARHEADRKAEAAHHITKDFDAIRAGLGFGVDDGTDKADIAKLIEEFNKQPLRPLRPTPHPTQPFPFLPLQPFRRTIAQELDYPFGKYHLVAK